MRGTILNTATVAIGGAAGWLVGRHVPEAYKAVALHGLGLVTVGIGIRMFLQGKNPIITAVAIALGGVIGLALGLHEGIQAIAEWAKHALGQGHSTNFVNGVVTTFVLYCVGPMTLLGCIEDALEKKIDLLALKSTMDGIGAFFFAASTGGAVLVTAVLLFLFQGALTLMARPLSPLAKDKDALAELSSAGGAILIATALGLLEIADLHNANYLPAIFIAPAIVLGARRVGVRRKA